MSISKAKVSTVMSSIKFQLQFAITMMNVGREEQANEMLDKAMAQLDAHIIEEDT